MPLAAHAVGQHTGPGHAGAVVLQAKASAPKVPAMADASTTASTGTPKCCARSAALGVPSEQAHHAFDQDEVVLCAAACRRWRAVGLAVHPQVQLVHRLAAGELVPVRVQKVSART